VSDVFDPATQPDDEADVYHIHVGTNSCVAHTVEFAEVVRFVIAEGVDPTTFEEKHPGYWRGETAAGVWVRADKRKAKKWLD
jgi:hypothetical protein